MSRSRRNWVLGACLFLSGAAWGEAGSRARAEQELRKYLRGRALVFRRWDLTGTRLRFGPSGRLLQAEGPLPGAPLQALWPHRVSLDREGLLLVGEPLTLSVAERGFQFAPDPRFLWLIRCRILLEEGEQFSLHRLKVALTRVFFTSHELHRLASPRGDP